MSNPFSPARRRAASALALAMPLLASGQPAVEEVEVVGTPHDRSPAELAQSVSVLRGDALQRAQSSTLGETLANELGVSSSYFGSGSSRPIIRGLAGPRVKIMEDGVDALDLSTLSADHAVGVDPLVARQIEIFRGPTTLLYGSGAAGGVVNVVTNRIPESTPDGGIDGAVEVRADSVAEERGAAFAVDGGGTRWAWHADGALREGDDYDIPGIVPRDGAHDDPHEGESRDDAVEGFVPNSDFETSSAALGGAWLGDVASFGVAVSGFGSNYGVPGHGHGSEDEAGGGAATADDDVVRIDLDRTRVDVKAEWLGAFRRFPEIALRAARNDYRHVELEGAAAGTVFDNEAHEGRVEVVHSPWGRWEGVFGAQLGARELSAVGAEAVLPPVDTRSAGVFMLEARELGAWEASVGGRVERTRHDPDVGSPVSGTARSVSGAVIRELANGHAFVVNTALAERTPGAEELYSNGPHLASGTFEIGNAALGTETSRHVDLGLRKTAGRVTWAATAFHTRYDGFIYLAAAGVEDAGTGLPVFAYAQRDAELSGFEGEAFASVARIAKGEIDVRVYTDFVSAKLDTGERLPRIPPRRYGARVQYHDERVAAGIEAVRYDDQDDIAPYEEATGGYTLVGADFRIAFPRDGGTELSVFFRASNLLDEDARKHASLVKDLAPLPGRNYALGFRTSF